MNQRVEDKRDIPSMYEAAESRMPESIRRLGTAHPTYQELLRQLVAEIARDRAISQR